MSHHPLSPGSILNDNYRVARVLRSGAGGLTYQADDLASGRMVVVKLLPFQTEMAQRKKFEEDFQFLRNLPMTGLPAYIDTFWNSDLLAVVREFVAGLDVQTELRERLAVDGRGFPASLAVRTAIQVASVLEGLHRIRPRPLVHGNIKPSNLITQAHDQAVVLVDAGLSWRSPGGNAGRTMFMEAGFSAPEQFLGPPTTRSDQYALGASLHYLLSGKAPAPNYLKPLAEFPDLQLPLELCEVVRQATQPRPEERFESMQDLRRQLERLQAKL